MKTDAICIGFLYKIKLSAINRELFALVINSDNLGRALFSAGAAFGAF